MLAEAFGRAAEAEEEARLAVAECDDLTRCLAATSEKLEDERLHSSELGARLAKMEEELGMRQDELAVMKGQADVLSRKAHEAGETEAAARKSEACIASMYNNQRQELHRIHEMKERETAQTEARVSEEARRNLI